VIRQIAILLTLGPAVALAQSSSGYLFVAPGGVTSGGYTSMTIQAGAGADVHLVKGLGLNMEIGAVGPREDYSQAVGMFSPGATWYFRKGKELKFEPFVNGGYTLMFREGHANLAYFGGGANYWAARRVGLRMEFRDHVYSPYSGAAHFWGFRFGLALR
jgi:hypothetical protein